MQGFQRLFGSLMRGESRPLVTPFRLRGTCLFQIPKRLPEPVLCTVGHTPALLQTAGRKSNGAERDSHERPRRANLAWSPLISRGKQPDRPRRLIPERAKRAVLVAESLTARILAPIPWGDITQPSRRLLWRSALGQTAVTGSRPIDRLLPFLDAADSQRISGGT